MNVSFEVFGLNFDAQVNMTPAYASSLCEPAEPSETEILKLHCEGKECLFLLDSPILSDEILCAAGEAASEYARDARDNAAISRAERRREEAMHP